ncbi:hypothetical protein [Novosphingobium sp.]|uniref:hypothetical protein n=1 Tax=Novosphingobium sp. TaxID=1874826 RepID=UPI00286D7625|nr:hypothetical protein [Novosphingobium sp.]
MNDKNHDLAPEAHNLEQDDEAAQAQQIAEEAGNPDDSSPLDSEKVGGGVEGVDEQDLIDHMRDMEASGRIDMGAFAGEPNMDDEDETYGEGHDPDKV